jgi:hypothetical protein
VSEQAVMQAMAHGRAGAAAAQGAA